MGRCPDIQTLLSCTTYALCCWWKGNASGKMLICTPGLCACHMLHVPLMFLMKDVFSCFLCCSLVLMTTEIRRDRGIMCGVKGLVSENQDKGEPQKSRREGIVLNKQQGGRRAENDIMLFITFKKCAENANKTNVKTTSKWLFTLQFLKESILLCLIRLHWFDQTYSKILKYYCN